jgi:O-antigen biosynthesis protein
VTAVSVVIPVKDAGPGLGRVLDAARSQGEVELIVIDSGSSDGSAERARQAGAEVIEIPPSDFGHGRTRNLGAEKASGELICFLTQDAVPLPGWLDAYRSAFALDERVGAAFGPHLPHPETSPMIARELTEFFAAFSPDGGPVAHRAGDTTFLSNVNACYSRACWKQIRFDDVDYAEDQAFGRKMLDAGWTKVFHPEAGVLHAHDYGPLRFMQRYFDEFRGLRDVHGHVEPLHPVEAARQVARDLRWMRRRGYPARRVAAWLPRSAVHHFGRRAAASLGSRSRRLPGPVQQVMSLEGRSDGSGPPRARSVAPSAAATPYHEVARLAAEGPAPLADSPPGTAERARLHIAVAIPFFTRGSGGHNTLFELVRRLEDAGHTCSIWMYDPLHHHGQEAAAVLRRRITRQFVPVRAPVFKGFDEWTGADVAVATGWDTAFAVALLPGCRARAYVINDHEPEFFATSAQRRWAEQTYGFGFYGISASRWLCELLRERYGQRGTWFRLGVDSGVYQPRPVRRRDDTVIFYARGYTPRRAVPLGLLALEELHRRRPELRIVLFGQEKDPLASFPYESLGIATPEALAASYSEATVGLCLSLTNYSLIPQEMMACGLPCVDVTGGSSEAEFGRDGPLELAEPDPTAIADALERLVDDDGRRRRKAALGLEVVETADWETAARRVEEGLREALREREGAPTTAS